MSRSAAYDDREERQVARLEQGVAGVRGERAEHVGALHRHDHRAVAAGGLARQPAVLTRGQRGVAGVDERDDLVAQVVLVAPGAGGVEELRAAVARPAVREHDDRVRAVAGGEHRVEALEHRRLQRRAVGPHVELAGVAHDHVDAGERPRVIGLHARRAVDPQRPARRVAERVGGQQLGFDDEAVERAVYRALPRGAGGALDLVQGHVCAPDAARSGSGAKNGVDT